MPWEKDMLIPWRVIFKDDLTKKLQTIADVFNIRI